MNEKMIAQIQRPTEEIFMLCFLNFY